MSIEEILAFAQTLWAFIVAHKWVPLAALVVGFLVRLLKSDTKIPITLPPEWRNRAAVILGVVAGILERVANQGVPWPQAIFEGLFASFLAIVGHKAIVDSMRGGKEFAIPFLIIPGASPSPDKPVTIPPSKPTPPPGLSMLMLVIGALVMCFAIGCAKLVKVLDLAKDKAECVAANQELADEAVWAKCFIVPADVPRYLDLLSTSRAATKRALQRAGATSDRSDAGAEGGK